MDIYGYMYKSLCVSLPEWLQLRGIQNRQRQIQRISWIIAAGPGLAHVHRSWREHRPCEHMHA